MNGQLEAAIASMGLVSLLILARLVPYPELAFVLQMMSAGGALGLAVAFARYRSDPTADRWRTIAEFSLGGLTVGVFLVLLDALSLM